jgi:oxygen-independent coproporphyrinogen-3 oxidase
MSDGNTVSVAFSSAPRLTALPPLSLYIHVPWCVRKCPYCDFNSHEAKGELPERQYLDALARDLESALPQIWGRKIHSVFFGGGTPSLLLAAALDEILVMVRALLPLESYTEITLEANPGTFEAEKFKRFRDSGVNRLSLGIQSFNPVHLQALGRIHDDSQARHAIEVAQKYFDNINLDLMYALPEQTLEEALQDMRIALGFGVQHISAYHLTLEPNTLFHRYPPNLPDDDLAAEMQVVLQQELATHGYEHYETSAFARPDKRCRHNLNYWRFGDYLGIGPGAHSKISLPDRMLRQMRYKQPRAYLENAALGKPVQTEQEISRKEVGFEFMMNALRLTEGIPVSLFQQRTGYPLTLMQRSLNVAEQRGLIERNHQHIAPTELGQRFLNDLLQLFLSEDEP